MYTVKDMRLDRIADSVIYVSGIVESDLGECSTRVFRIHYPTYREYADQKGLSQTGDIDLFVQQFAMEYISEREGEGISLLQSNYVIDVPQVARLAV